MTEFIRALEQEWLSDGFCLGTRADYSRHWGHFCVVEAECEDQVILVCWGRRRVWPTRVVSQEHKSSLSYLERNILEAGEI